MGWQQRDPSLPPFIGTIRGDSFRMQRDIRYRNSFLPVIRVHVQAEGVGTRVTATMMLHPLVAIFMRFACSPRPPYFLIKLVLSAWVPRHIVKFADRYRKMFTAAGVPTGHSHRFRDTAACELLLAGVSMEDVAEFLGNTLTQKSTRRLPSFLWL
jgi:integrase